MKLWRKVFSLGAASLLLAAGALAVGVIKGTLRLYETVTVRGKQLTPGVYTVVWNGRGPNVELSLARGKRTVVSVPARVTPVKEKNATDGYSVNSAGGENVLSEIFFYGKTYELEIRDQAAGRASQPVTSVRNR
jgi:hypothetical protein